MFSFWGSPKLFSIWILNFIDKHRWKITDLVKCKSQTNTSLEISIFGRKKLRKNRQIYFKKLGGLQTFQVVTRSKNIAKKLNTKNIAKKIIHIAIPILFAEPYCIWFITNIKLIFWDEIGLIIEISAHSFDQLHWSKKKI